MKLFDDTVLKGAIDIHIHVGPDYMPRYADAVPSSSNATLPAPWGRLMPPLPRCRR